MFSCHSRCGAPRPQSIRIRSDPASINVEGPNRATRGRGVPVPSKVTFSVLSCALALGTASNVTRTAAAIFRFISCPPANAKASRNSATPSEPDDGGRLHRNLARGRGAAEADPVIDGNARQQAGDREQAGELPATDLRGKRPRTRRRDAPPETERDAADQMLAPRRYHLPRDRGPVEDRPDSERAKRADTDRCGHDRRHHEEKDVSFLQQQHAADHVGLGESRPAEDETKRRAEQQPDGVRVHEPPPASHAMTCADAIPVAMKVAVLTRLAREPKEVPQMPWPDVQPPAMRPPMPINAPAISSVAALSGRPAPTSASTGPYASVGFQPVPTHADSRPPATMPSVKKTRQLGCLRRRSAHSVSSMYPPSAPNGLFRIQSTRTTISPISGPATNQGAGAAK